MDKQRIGLIVWLRHPKHAKILRRYGNVHYVSNRLNYAIVYCDEHNHQSMMNALMKQKPVENVERSALYELRQEHLDQSQASEEEVNA